MKTKIFLIIFTKPLHIGRDDDPQEKLDKVVASEDEELKEGQERPRATSEKSRKGAELSSEGGRSERVKSSSKNDDGETRPRGGAMEEVMEEEEVHLTMMGGVEREEETDAEGDVEEEEEE